MSLGGLLAIADRRYRLKVKQSVRSMTSAVVPDAAKPVQKPKRGRKPMPQGAD
jgi:hypothetical protein